jgi:hypothetical protein
LHDALGTVVESSEYALVVFTCQPATYRRLCSYALTGGPSREVQTKYMHGSLNYVHKPSAYPLAMVHDCSEKTISEAFIDCRIVASLNPANRYFGG